jgi:uncharacterized membrane protein
LSFERVVFFSDAVFAIVITLLVHRADLAQPDLPADGVVHALSDGLARRLLQ